MFKSLKVPGTFIVDKAGEVEDEREPKLTGDEPKIPHSGSLGKISFVVPPSAAKLHPHQRRERRGYGQREPQRRTAVHCAAAALYTLRSDPGDRKASPQGGPSEGRNQTPTTRVRFPLINLVLIS